MAEPMILDKSGQCVVQPGQYQHFKGGVYRVMSVATHSETGEHYVIYTSEKSGELWIRPLSMFTELVSVDGRTRARFERLRELEAKPRKANGSRSRQSPTPPLLLAPA